LKAFIIFEKFDALIVHEPSPITQGFPVIVVKKMQGPDLFLGFRFMAESLIAAGGINNK
jgi:hypothetical protein